MGWNNITPRDRLDWKQRLNDNEGFGADERKVRFLHRTISGTEGEPELEGEPPAR